MVLAHAPAPIHPFYQPRRRRVKQNRAKTGKKGHCGEAKAAGGFREFVSGWGGIPRISPGGGAAPDMIDPCVGQVADATPK
jgi:hypothetical protein